MAGDREYACKALVRELALQSAFVGPAVMDAALYAPPSPYRGLGRPRKVGRRLRSPEQLASSRSTRWQKITIHAYGRRMKLLIKEQTCLWYTVAGTRLVKLVVTRDLRGRAVDRAYFSTDPQIPAVTILERFARRWLIEVSFRDVKQHLGVEDPQNGWGRRARRRPGRKKPGPQPRGNRGRSAVFHTVPIAFVAYAVVLLWYLDEGDPRTQLRHALERSPWYRHKAAPSFCDMLVALRRETWLGRLFQHPGHRRLRAKLRRLLPDALLAA